MTDEEFDRLEAEIPALAVEAGRAAHVAALRVGSVLVFRDNALVELFRDGRQVVIKPMPPQSPVTPGTSIRIKP